MGVVDIISKAFLAAKEDAGYLVSEEQIKQIDEQRRNYLEKRQQQSGDSDINRLLGAVSVEAYQSYLRDVDTIYSPIDINRLPFHADQRILYFNITKWVHDPEEKNLDKLVNVYQVLSDESVNIALIYDRNHEESKVYLVIADISEKENRARLNELGKGVEAAINGNFPGVEIKKGDIGIAGSGFGLPECLNYEVKGGQENRCSVASVSSIPSDKSEYFISQSMEKLLDGIVPESEDRYTIVLMATPVKGGDDRRARAFELYSSIAHFAGWQTSYTISEGKNIGTSVTNSNSISAGVSVGSPGGPSATVNRGYSYSKTLNESISLGESEGNSRNYVNYTVKHTLETLEKHVKRMDESAALGMWDFSAYVISDDRELTRNVAYMYLALVQGEESYVGQSAVNFWNYDRNEDVDVLLESIKRFQHPMFILRDDIIKEDINWLMYPTIVNATVMLSGKELAKALNFPRKSVSGLPVLESASFGRDVQRYDTISENADDAKIGNIYHMRRRESKEVILDYNSLTSHVFVTGSTGAGKSNTIYQLISRALVKDKKVLVIEPAKGEYKDVFGGTFDHVYGTNVKKTELIKLNPFSFPDEVHVLEHIDRLIEILNACWPMYAAMPAVLKDAVERAYVNRGWNLDTSECYPRVFPVLSDLLETLPEVMDSSSYSKDTKSDYAGALITRVNSLTNGINGQIFCASDYTKDEELFEKNVIVDISRVGSAETKSMMMGILILKLQEYRMHQREAGKLALNGELHHLTVLEEAHNLLRRTGTSQSQDSANLQGKSVEMITNSIAEMRTYGEGFIIADQAPGLLDEAVIRNTNTKIILRLPDGDDRELVGRAAALTNAQIDELAKLPKGVAAVYQNDWVEAVLCAFDRFLYASPYEKPKDIGVSAIPKHKLYEKTFGNNEHDDLSREDVDLLEAWISSMKVSASVKSLLRRALVDDALSDKEKTMLAFKLFNGKQIAMALRDSVDASKGIEIVDSRIKGSAGIEDDELAGVIRQFIVRYICEKLPEGDFTKRYIEYGKGVK